jgi:hypothetical protein
VAVAGAAPAPPQLGAERAVAHLGAVAVERHDVRREGHRRWLVDLREVKAE